MQLGLALWIYGRLPGIGVAGLRTGNVHRAIGTVALLVTLPIAYHCAFAYGVKTNIDTRVAVHEQYAERRTAQQTNHLTLLASPTLPDQQPLPPWAGSGIWMLALPW